MGLLIETESRRRALAAHIEACEGGRVEHRSLP
jgi:hypothetical protein